MQLQNGTQRREMRCYPTAAPHANYQGRQCFLLGLNTAEGGTEPADVFISKLLMGKTADKPLNTMTKGMGGVALTHLEFLSNTGENT